MKIENQIRAFAGTFILLSLVMAHFHSPNWYYFTAFVGVNLLQSAFTKFCPLETILCKIQKKS
ncbi:MAG: sulfurtransferase [Oligoflexia bacterium]|nr:MAG: sulfurtransferase [Oligoflexia bacterium]